MVKKEKIVAILGYFDCIHNGHSKLIKVGLKKAQKLNCKAVLFTFNGNLRGYFNNAEKAIFSKEERAFIFKEIGIKKVHYFPINKEFLSLDKKEFLDYINSLYNIQCYVCGEDWTFSKNKGGNTSYLKEYAKEKNQSVAVQKLKYISINKKREKLSSTLIKTLINEGKIKRVNSLLFSPLFIIGKVIKDRGLGTKIGIKTANIPQKKDRVLYKSGVYKGITIVDDKEYLSVINIGFRPTVENRKTQILETHLIDFDGDLTNKIITVKLLDFIREEKKFDSIEKLKIAIQKDVEKVVKI